MGKGRIVLSLLRHPPKLGNRRSPGRKRDQVVNAPLPSLIYKQANMLKGEIKTLLKKNPKIFRVSFNLPISNQRHLQKISFKGWI